MKRITHTKDSLAVVEFALRCMSNGGWHSYASDKRTKKAVQRAAFLGAVELSPDTQQFRLTNAGNVKP